MQVYLKLHCTEHDAGLPDDADVSASADDNSEVMIDLDETYCESCGEEDECVWIVQSTRVTAN